MDKTLRAVNRFGLGARVGQRATISDPRTWLRAQLHRDAARLPAAGLPTLAQAAASLRDGRDAQRSGDQEMIQESRRTTGQLVESERGAVLQHRLTTATPYVERLVAFWSNHLCVATPANIAVVPFAGLYERQVIRPYVLGRFRDMVRASAQHPAMLLYLNNAQSIGPGSSGARWWSRLRGQERGLNENYARELLELHTLGVNGGYDQGDVEQMARLLTGWTLSGAGPLARPGEPFGFVFRSQLHEPGTKTVVGKRYHDGIEEGEQAIADLCAHPSTARFLAIKLVRHFVADDPPARAVDEIAAVFRGTDGDLRQVSEALIDLPEAWAEDSVKFRTPQDWLVATGRALGLDRFPARLQQVLRQLRHPLWGPQAPKGFDDLMGPWADPDSLMNRAELARTIATAVAGARPDPGNFLDVIDADSGSTLAGLLRDRSIPTSERVALAIGGPEFQWR